MRKPNFRAIAASYAAVRDDPAIFRRARHLGKTTLRTSLEIDSSIVATSRTRLSTVGRAVCIVVMCAFLTPSMVDASGFGTSGGFFKVVKPPAKGARKRMTIHDASRPAPSSRHARADHAWFWKEASAKIGDAAADRLVPLASFAAKRLSSSAASNVVTQISDTYRAEIATAAKRAGISEALLIAVVAAESRGNPKAVSSAGAQGLAQLMPGTAQRFQVNNPFDPAQNLRGSAEYLSILLKMFGEDTLLALAGYNAGENAVIRHKGIPPYAETRNYVPIVLSYWYAARSRCAEAPIGPRAPCETAALPNG